MQEEVSLANAAPDLEIEDPSEIIAQAIQEVKRCLHVTNDSLANICREMEEAISGVMIRPIFRRFNSVTQVFSEADFRGEVRRAYCKGAQRAWS